MLGLAAMKDADLIPLCGNFPHAGQQRRENDSNWNWNCVTSVPDSLAVIPFF